MAAPSSAQLRKTAFDYRQARPAKMGGFVSINRLIWKPNSQIKVSRFAKFLVAVGATLCFLGKLHATGYYGPDVYLDEGGKNVDGSPEFYWGLEVRRLAKEFHPTEKRVVSEK